MVNLVAVTRNKGKMAEIRKLAPDSFVISDLSSLDFTNEIPETGDTFAQNASQKAQLIHKTYGVNCLADDSGLEVKALDGRPGIFSARYAGPGATDLENMNKLLKEMDGKSDRTARFVCVISLIINNKEYFFDGTLDGSIAISPTGTNGFGYDPVFIPVGDNRTLATYLPEEKNRISHRAKAFAALRNFLRTIELTDK
ncbi:MAG TPA: RdgB/HAM1 family non-canonical purine NTP pyrophosphatase [Bacteroidia bacterium]|nr:RdgB/HAM1 family non-canonical purine NTP pyrophosphatase [Bacteroidia bacterium]